MARWEGSFETPAEETPVVDAFAGTTLRMPAIIPQSEPG
jgi:hypothetical protein